MADLPELRLLRSFAVIAEEGSLSRAAARLTIAQQSLSQQVRVLEGQIGAPLLHGTSRGVSLTEVGEVLLREALPVLGHAERAMDAIGRSVRGEGVALRAGFLSSLANEVMPPVVRLMLAGAPSLTLADLTEEDWVMTPRSSWPPWHRKYDSDFVAAGLRPRIVRRSTSPQGLLALVAAGVGITRLAASARSLRIGGVSFVELRDERAAIVLLRRPGDRNPAIDRLYDVACDALQDTLPGFLLSEVGGPR